jgi:hypothetical protein
MSCLPGTPCEGTIYTVYPASCIPSAFLGYPICSDLVCYYGPNLPNTGINNGDLLTAILQDIDSQLSEEAIANAFYAAIVNNPSLKQIFCNIVNECIV